MKKLLLLFSAFVVLVIPILAQDAKEEVPLESLTLKKGNIPPPVLKTANELFKGDTQVEWGKFPYELKDLGWYVNKEYNDPIDHYAIHIKRLDGSDIFAVFESTGELIKYRMVKKNAPLPEPVMAAVKNSGFKDWKITNDLELIKSSQKKIAEHYVVKIEKDKKKKTLYITPQGGILKGLEKELS